MASKCYNRKGGASLNGITPGGRKQRSAQRKLNKAVKKGKTLNIAIDSEEEGFKGNFQLDPKGIKATKGGLVSEYSAPLSLNEDGILSANNKNYSKDVPDPIPVYANQDLGYKIGKKVNFEKQDKKLAKKLKRTKK